jgi:uncharacterized protein YndB with AHSA1/START domain
MHVERTVTIERPIEEVFEYVSTPENDPTWIPSSLKHERTSPGPMRVGMTTQEDQKFFGRTSRDTWEVTEYEPPTVVAYRATSGQLPLLIRLWFEPVDGGTRMTHVIDMEPRGIFYKALAPMMPWAIQWGLGRVHRTLKDLLEGKPITPSRRLESNTSGAMTEGIVVASVVGVIALLLLVRRRSGSSRR